MTSYDSPRFFVFVKLIHFFLPVYTLQSTTMAQMVKAVRMILGRESFGSAPKTIQKSSFDDIEIKGDAPESKPSLEELDALEVTLILLL